MNPMKTGFGILVVALGVLLIAPPQAKADVQTIRDSNNEIWGAAGTSLFNYKESIGPLPDSEHGWIPSLAAGVDYMTNDDLFLALEGSVDFGNAHYNGSYFFFPDTPLQGTTRETVTNIDGKIGQGIPLAGMAMLTPYVELGFRYWDRNLGGGQVEDYQNFDTLAGLMVQVSPVSRLTLSAYGSAGTTFAAQMRTGGDTYDLGSAGAYKIGGKVGFDVTQRVELFTTLDYDHFRYAQSGVVDGAIEPGSGTEDTTLRVGLGYHFK